MSSVEHLAPHTAGSFQIAVTGPRTIELRGVLEVRDPVAEVGPYLRKLHDAAVGGGELLVDVTAFTFVNSSGLRIFLDWLGWLTAEPADKRYRLRFRVSQTSSWQAAAFPAIEMLGGELVAIERA